MDKIQFATPAEHAASTTTTPWAPVKTGNYQDMLLKPEYETRRLRHTEGTTWFRVVPAFKQSRHGWMLAIRTVEFPGGKCVHPRTLRSETKSAFDLAYSWYAIHRPNDLFSKSNKSGVRLLTNDWCAFWCVVEQRGRYVARLFTGSGYDGTRGGNAGLGYEIWRTSRDKDETGEIMRHVAHPTEGVLVGISKIRPQGVKYPRYEIHFGRRPISMDEILEKMDPDEQSALCPLEDTIRVLSPEEEWQCVEKIVGAETVSLIRKDLGL